MSRTDRCWTAAVAECGLHRARPMLAMLMPQPFDRVDLARALAATGLVLDRNTGFAGRIRPKLEVTLDGDAKTVFAALARLPFDERERPATVFWRRMFRGRAGADDAAPDWLNQVAEGTQWLRDVSALAKTQRALPLTPHDRSIYARFGWNDDGEIPGLTGLLDAAALLRTERAWAVAAPNFEAESQRQIMAAAGQLIATERIAAMATLNDDVRRYGVPRVQLAAVLYPAREVPPLHDILTEAA